MVGKGSHLEYCRWGINKVDGVETDFEDRTDWFSDFARGEPGQMLMGLNRQYTHHASFHNFPSALKLLFQCATGQDWKFVMYAVSGEPGKPGAIATTGAFYFISFFFLSNYILLNLFVAVILDNFSASMRESELDVAEEDFIVFKFAFRKKTPDDTPDLLLYKDLWALLVTIGGSDVPDNKGVVTVNAMSPSLETHWAHDQEMAWALNVESGESPKSCKRFLQKIYNTANSPLKLPGQPGISFSEFWNILMDTEANYSQPHLSDLDNAFPQRAEWDTYIANGGETADGSENESPTYSTIKTALATLRFRVNYKKLVTELEFHNQIYAGEGSEIKYDQLLQSLVNVAMGEKALSLEDQLARGVDSITGWKSDEAQTLAEIAELEATLKQWQEKLQYAKMNSKGGSLGAKEVSDLEKQVSRLEAALAEKREQTGVGEPEA